MTVSLRVVLDQVVSPVDADLAAASRELGRALVATAPSGCVVEAIVPAAGADAADTLETAVPGLADITRLRLPRRELATAWQLGAASGAAGGLIHAPTLMAPLIKHDRIHDHDQTVVTLWDLDAWERPDEMSRSAVAWHRAMLKRAAKHADAVVVPTHAAAARLSGLGGFGDRIRVISGAPIEDFRVPSDEVGRRRELTVPEGCILLSGSAAASARLSDAFAAIAAHRTDLPVVVIDAPAGDEPAIVQQAVDAGIGEGRLHVRGVLDAFDRGAVLGGALVFIAPSTTTRFPWRLIEAMRVGVPVVAAGSDVHREVVVDGGLLADPDDPAALAAAVGEVLGSGAAVERWAVLAGDRGRAFSWAGAAERVWQLHADL
ncbi:glycosyltransferase [Microbacterium sp. MC2]